MLVLPIIRCCKLDGYMLGTKLCHAEFITKAYVNALTIKQLNPTYEDRQACDQQLLGWLKNFMTQDLATQLLHYENSKKLWEDYDWYFDSGASNHMTHHTDKFQDLTEHHDKNSLFVGNGEKLKIVTTCSSKLKSLNLHDVLYVPNITKNILSVSKLDVDNNILVEFDANYCFVKDKLTWKTILRGTLKEGLYQLSGIEKYPRAYVSVKESWHRRLGHPNNKVLDKVLTSCNIKPSPIDHFSFCEACQYGKMHLLPFKSSFSHAQETLELVHTDV